MQNIRRSVMSSKSIWRGSLRPFVESKILLNDFASASKRSPVDRNSSFARQYVTGANNISKAFLSHLEDSVAEIVLLGFKLRSLT
ncbi:hypothetical protein V6N13_004531 [Hibiscus sabdariffa]